jgi:hypothetical protein
MAKSPVQTATSPVRLVSVDGMLLPDLEFYLRDQQARDDLHQMPTKTAAKRSWLYQLFVSYGYAAWLLYPHFSPGSSPTPQSEQGVEPTQKANHTPR